MSSMLCQDLYEGWISMSQMPRVSQKSPLISSKKYQGHHKKKKSRTCWGNEYKDVHDSKSGKHEGAPCSALMQSCGKCILAEYIWLDAYQIPRSKTTTLSNEPQNVKDLPTLNYDGSRTEQAEGQNHDILLHPRCIFKDPFRSAPHILVLCDVYNSWDGKPSIGNTRASCVEVMKKFKEHAPWFSMGQQYTLVRFSRVGEDSNQPLGFNADGSKPAPQGTYYCSVGTGNCFGRKVADEHYLKCLHAGVKIAGQKALAMPGRWEFQVGPCRDIEMGDHLTVARYIMLRVTESHDCICSFSPKPVDCDWKDAKCHTSFSTKEMRAQCGYDVIKKVCEAFRMSSKEEMTEYGPDNETRRKPLTKAHESCDYFKPFKCGVVNGDVSIHIPYHTEQDRCGYMEDRRPAANCDPYRVTACMMTRTSKCLALVQAEACLDEKIEIEEVIKHITQFLKP